MRLVNCKTRGIKKQPFAAADKKKCITVFCIRQVYALEAVLYSKTAGFMSVLCFAPRLSRMNEFFRRFSHQVAQVTGSSSAFIAAFGVILVWLLTGPIFGFSDTWQLVINTGTTIITFLMVFLIQNAQNRDAKALHLKLDELIRAVQEARNEIIEIEGSSDSEIERLNQEFHLLRQAAQK